MKNAKYIIILLTAMFLAFIIGLFVGRSNYDGSISVLTDHRTEAVGKVDLNTGTMDEFCLLPGISEIMAQRIIDYREENGPYENIEDLCNVSGISEARLEELRSYLTVGG